MIERFWDRVMPEPNSGCWLWTGKLNRTGYGLFYLGDRREQPAHRFAYELLIGPIPQGLVLDHLCRVHCCVNPAHCEPVTIGENVKRGTPGIHKLKQTHCPNGHALTPENIYWDKQKNQHRRYRRCRACMRKRNTEWARKSRQTKRSLSPQHSRGVVAPEHL